MGFCILTSCTYVIYMVCSPQNILKLLLISLFMYVWPLLSFKEFRFRKASFVDYVKQPL